MATILSDPRASGGSRPASAGAYKVDVSRGERIGRVSSEWFSRPDDERFLSLGALHAAVRARAERATARTVETKAQVGDFAMVAQSLLPHLGHGDHDQWISYGQQFLASAMESWVVNAMGSSAEFVAALGSANKAQLKALCQDTSAARYFEEGGERMLASILGTVTPAVASLRSFAVQAGPAFSVRRWVREGRGSLWMPYAANQIAALRGLISCWMNLAIMETLSLAPSTERRIWFHVDELDALGRIEGLKDAQARLRKFGGRVAIGFQSFAQVKQIYGEGSHTIIENCGNLLLLRCGLSEGGGTAELASDLIGNREVERENVSQSRTCGRYTSRSVSMQSKRSLEDVALASEITQLPNREGFVKTATAPDWWRAGSR